MPEEALLAHAAELVEQADLLVIAAGAGMGVDSGLPDFRGSEGFWQAYPALGRAGIDFYRIANPASFATQPRLAWGFYGHRLALYRRTVPHEGFAILRGWAERTERGAIVYTSNVDGQFQQAGFEPGQIWECHGSLLQRLHGRLLRINLREHQVSSTADVGLGMGALQALRLQGERLAAQ